MASWIVHLRIAEKLLERIPGLDAAQFAIGNVAPDSGIPDEKWEHFDPPSRISHFHPENRSEISSEDLRFFRQYLAGVPLEERDKFSLLLGYFFHLITDNLWWLEIGKPTEEKYSEEFTADKGFIWEVKRDWYGLDFAHVRAYPEGIFWNVFLPAEYGEHCLDFYKPEAIPRQLDYIKTYYQRQDEDVDKKLRLTENIYLAAKEMDTFVENAVEILFEIYERIWGQSVDIGELQSALELVEYI
jgi:hypothetical protein